ncbi:MAG: hypothetical protein K1X72_25525 [Pyrinomonadaceae bacterium]|nr:hypothetical protein [Pyrinomonadaceae bacterium]
MKKKKSSKTSSLFNSIRKPTAPPTQKIGKDKPDEKALPSGRKAKHKNLRI